MNLINPLTKQEKNKIVNKLKEQFGVKDLPFDIVKMGKDRLYAFKSDLTEKELKTLESLKIIASIGFYFGKFDERTNDIRLSIEGSQILGNQITKNIFQLNDKQVEEWMKGHELNIKTGKKGFLIIKHGDDFLGSGKASEEKIGNFIPKERRLREPG